MADTVHEFHNANSSLAALQSGVNIATTTGSQTAVVREIQFNNPNGRSLEVKVGDFSIGTTNDNTGFTGKELLKASQSITLSTTESALWTGIRRQGAFGSTATYQQLDFNSAHYFSPPTADTVMASDSGWVQGDFQNGGGEPPTNPSAWGNQMEYWDGENQFSKPAGDYYYARWAGNTRGSTGNNQLYYYDYSADSSTQLVGTDNSCNGWFGKWSNKYLVRFNYSSTEILHRYYAVDTTNNSVYKSNVQFTRAYDTNTSSERNVEGCHKERGTVSCLDNLCLYKGAPHVNNGARFMSMFNIDNGKYITFKATLSTSDRTSGFSASSSGANNYDAPASLCRGEDGTYYILNVFFADTSSGANKGGIECISLGKTPVTTYLSHGSPGGYNGDGRNGTTVAWYYDIHGAGITDYTEFRATSNSSGQKDSMSAHFFPLKKTTATDSKSRYWVYMAHKHTILIDLNQTTGSAACTRIKFNDSYAGTSGSDEYYPWGDVTDTGNELYADNTGPIYDTTAANTAWGTVGCRVTGILST